jgi:hypothetical protein
MPLQSLPGAILVRLLAVTALVGSASALSAPPILYQQGLYQSPVSGDPDDLMLLAGYGFAADDTVVYRATQSSTQDLSPPSALPVESTPTIGVAPVVSRANIPYSLTIRLPQLMQRSQTYTLWVRTGHGEWSDGIRINDARPLWFTPGSVYASHAPAFLPRQLKVVGRNLNPVLGQSTRVRLSGPQQFTGNAVHDPQSSASLDRYVVRVGLPNTLIPGSYQVQVSRDGVSWVKVSDQKLEVTSDAPAAREFPISDARYGGCRPDDGKDDTICVLRAIGAAKQAGGGSVYFGPGTWDLIDGAQPGVVATEGILVPPGVNLRGAGSDLTRLHRHPEWNTRSATAVFTLSRNSQVTGFTFRDLQVYHPNSVAGPYLKLGEEFRRLEAFGAPSGTGLVSNVVITHNVFDKPLVAIGSGGLPITGLFITHNTFGAYAAAIELPGNRYNETYRFRIDDSVIDYNTFKPGSELELTQKFGTIVSEVGAGSRVDFSNNTADGASADYLYSPTDPKGWRAAFFWNMNNNVEETLVSQNTATCTGDKIGDGEAFAFDNNANTFGFADLASVSQATVDSITVSARLITKQSGLDVAVGTYYLSHWIQIASGPGLGQARRIVSYRTDPATGRTTFRVFPRWDVIPVADQTRIAIGREFWQLYVLDNLVDNRQPLCQKSNRSRRAAGAISMWAQSADSVIAGNRQYDSDGIFVQQNYVVPEHPCPDCAMESYLQAFLEIRANTIDGEYDWNNDCSRSGIGIGTAAAPWGAGAPPTVGFGVSVSNNIIRHADGQEGGAISQLDSWYPGAEPHRWPLSNNVIIQHNEIENIEGAGAMPICGTRHRARAGITFPDFPIAWHTVLYENSCKNVSTPVGTGGVDSISICPSSATDSCECPRIKK